MKGNSLDGYYLGRLLRQMFPAQTKTIPRTIVWSIVFLIDAGLAIWAAVALELISWAIACRVQALMVGLILIAALALFSLETWIYNRITAAIRMKKEEPLL